jgi:hypothetical protein
MKSFSLKNKIDRPIQIDWNATSYVDPMDSALRVMHDGLKYTDRDRPRVPSVIPPSASVQDVIVPIDNVECPSGSGWHTNALFGNHDETRTEIKQGGTFSLLLALVVNGKTENLFVTFEFDHVM